MKKLLATTLIACSLCGCAELQQAMNDIQAQAKEAVQEATQQDYFTVKSKSGKQYIVSNKTMEWNDAFTWCQNKGLNMADHTTRDSNGLISGSICGFGRGTDMTTIEAGKYNKQGACKEFTGLTKEDIFVWFHPTLDGGMRSLVVNLKTGGFRTSKIHDYDTLDWGKIPFVPSHAMCE